MQIPRPLVAGRESGLEVDEADPVGCNGDSGHVRHGVVRVVSEACTVGGPHVAEPGVGVFGDGSGDDLDAGVASDGEDLVRVVVGVDSDGYPWIS